MKNLFWWLVVIFILGLITFPDGLLELAIGGL